MTWAKSFFYVKRAFGFCPGKVSFRPIPRRTLPDRLDRKSTPAKTKEPARAGKPEKKSKTYTVKKGDCLWNIAKKFYGKGSDYTKIYNANKGTIGKNPNLIYPGQVFTIP